MIVSKIVFKTLRGKIKKIDLFFRSFGPISVKLGPQSSQAVLDIIAILNNSPVVYLSQLELSFCINFSLCSVYLTH